MPDRAEALTLPPGYRLFWFEALDSTNAEALRRLAAGGDEAEVLWARSQRTGRGRRGAVWHSPPGNLYMTVTVAVPDGRPASQLAFVAALGAGEAIRRVLPAGQSLRYKWPNDLMLGDKKLGGILIEGAMATEGNGRFAAGIGINVAHAPPGLEAACLVEAGAAVTLPVLLQAICHGFEHWRRRWLSEGFDPVRRGWIDRAWNLEAPVEARLPDGATARGLFRDIDPTGALVLRQDDGSERRIAAGEVLFAAA